MYRGQFRTITVAVKTLRPDCRAAGMYMDFLYCETEIFELLPEHENIIKLLGYCDWESRRFLLLEFCNLGSLLNFLTNNRFREGPEYGNLPNSEGLAYTYNNLLNFAHQIATGAEFLASQGVVHADLACRNVLLLHSDANIVAKITDFGLAHKLIECPTYTRRSEERRVGKECRCRWSPDH